MHTGIRLFVSCLILIFLQGQTQAPSGDPQLARRLQKGVNLNGWFVSAGTKPLDERFSETDLQLISGLGFSFVRLPIDPTRLISQGRLDENRLRALDHALDLITTSGLAVIVDLHPSPDFEGHALGDRDSLSAFVRLIEAFCIHLRLRSPADVGVELLNEPFDPGVGRGAWDWNAIQREFWRVARRALPEHTLILTGDVWSGISGLRTLVPVADSNVLYTVHFYQPYLFTHQGANWMASDPQHFAELHGVPYPGDSERVRHALEGIIAKLSGAKSRDSISGELVDYERAYWNRDKLAQSFSQAAEWASRQRKRLFLGEFGVYKRAADPADRCRWLRDVRELAEANHMPWAMWEYEGGFGLLNQDRTPDKCLVSALGLTPAEGE